MRVKDRTVTVRMRPLPESGVTVWEFEGELRGGIAGGWVWGVKEVRALAEDICEKFEKFVPKDPEYSVKYDGKDWIVEVSETVEVEDDAA